ncbi:MAG TPA: chorismate synthase [Chloroflexota bacterium]|nr:chorismate synthase [Chloroflexota bacterium]
MLRFLTAGESHGKALTTIIEGLPAGVPVLAEFINGQLSRRQKGYGRGGRMQIETDAVEILSGVRHGYSMGGPITLMIRNKDNPNWTVIMDEKPVDEEVAKITRLRPGHADMAGVIKYGLDDIRPILERSSARETTTRTAVAAVCRELLQEFGIGIRSHVVRVGPVAAGELALPADPAEWPWDEVDQSPMRCFDKAAEAEMVKTVDLAKERGDSVGGAFEVVAWGMPVGLGSVMHWDRRLDGLIAGAIMSIPAIKGVEIGEGFGVASLFGSQAQDQIRYDASAGWSRLSNRAGGTEGGMTNGQPLVVRVAVKPISTIQNALPSVDYATREESVAHFERADTCQVPAAGIVGEAMVAIVLAQTFLEKFAGDHLSQVRQAYDSYVRSYAPRERE